MHVLCALFLELQIEGVPILKKQDSLLVSL